MSSRPGIPTPVAGLAAPVLVVTGMHRSGTSLVASLVQAAGVHVGDTLFSANESNPRGYFEDVDFYEFHEGLLLSRQKSYLYPGSIGDDFEPTPEERDRAGRLIAARGRHRLWGWKDPRTALFLEFWRALVPQARFLFVYRHPLDVLLSLLRRGEFREHPNPTAGLAAWQAYNRKLVEFHERHPDACVVAHIAGVTDRFERLGDLLRDRLSIDVALTAETAGRIFHADELRQAPLPEEAVRILARIQPEVLALYDRLNAIADLPPPAMPPAAAVPQPVLGSLATAVAAWPEPLSLAARHAALELVVSALAAEPTDEMLRNFHADAAGLQRKVDAVWMHAQRLERVAAERERALEQQEQALQERDQALEGARLVIADLESCLQNQRREIDALAALQGSQQADLAERDRLIRRQANRIGVLSAAAGVEPRPMPPAPPGSCSPMSQPIRAGASQSGGRVSSFERIARARELQSQLRARPVTGSLRGLKKLLFQTLRSTFSRQFALNGATLDLIESLTRDVDRLRLQVQATAGKGAEPPAAMPVAALESVGPQIAFGEVVASCGMTQDQAKLNNIRPLAGFEAVYWAPAELRMPERVAIYGLVFGLQPKRCLEIGTFRGGSTAIICGALDDTGFGEVACVDPSPRVDPALWARLGSRCRMFEGPSPDILPEVGREVGEPFDFAFIDGNHTYDFVKRDIVGVLPLLADEAHLLFHDANYPDVKRAIDESVAAHRELVDCGLVSVEPTIFRDGDTVTTWAGLRLLRFRRAGR